MSEEVIRLKEPNPPLAAAFEAGKKAHRDGVPRTQAPDDEYAWNWLRGWDYENGDI